MNGFLPCSSSKILSPTSLKAIQYGKNLWHENKHRRLLPARNMFGGSLTPTKKAMDKYLYFYFSLLWYLSLVPSRIFIDIKTFNYYCKENIADVLFVYYLGRFCVCLRKKVCWKISQAQAQGDSYRNFAKVCKKFGGL